MDGFIIFCAKYLIFFVIILFGLAWLKQSNKNKKEMFLAAAIAGVVAVVLAKIGAKLFYDPRPFTKGSVAPLFPHGPDNGFPSDHAWFTMTLSAVLFYYNRQLAYVCLGLTAVIGIARVAAHVHSPIDIIGGFLIGIAAGIAGYWGAKKLLNRHPAKA